MWAECGIRVAYKYLHEVQGNEIPVQDAQIFAAASNGNLPLKPLNQLWGGFATYWNVV